MLDTIFVMPFDNTVMYLLHLYREPLLNQFQGSDGIIFLQGSFEAFELDKKLVFLHSHFFLC